MVESWKSMHARGFRGKRTCRDQVFSLRQVMEKQLREKTRVICSIH